MILDVFLRHLCVQPNSKLIRAILHIGMVCQTITSRPVEPGKEAELTRDEIQCKIMYAANGEGEVEAPQTHVHNTNTYEGLTETEHKCLRLLTSLWR